MQRTPLSIDNPWEPSDGCVPQQGAQDPGLGKDAPVTDTGRTTTTCKECVSEFDSKERLEEHQCLVNDSPPLSPPEDPVQAQIKALQEATAAANRATAAVKQAKTESEQVTQKVTTVRLQLEETMRMQKERSQQQATHTKVQYDEMEKCLNDGRAVLVQGIEFIDGKLEQLREERE